MRFKRKINLKITIKYFFVLLMASVLFANFLLPCNAITEKGELTVTLEDKGKNNINGMAVYICQIAELNNTGYYPTKAFENSGISVSGIINNPDGAAAKAVYDYIINNKVGGMSQISENGKVCFSDLNLGIWLVYCKSDGESKYTFNPYFVFLPYESGGRLIYQVSSVPKVEDNKQDEINIYVIKKWDDNHNAENKRPDSVIIELLKGDERVDSVELSDRNGWAHTFMNLPKEGKYSVREKKVDNYKVNYSGDITNGFIVTNTYEGEKLPQTGQLWWPIAVIAVAGIGFICLGIYELAVKKNEKKN